MKTPALLPCPRSLKILHGTFTLPEDKLLAAIKMVELNRGSRGDEAQTKKSAVRQRLLTSSPANHPEYYELTISKSGVDIQFREAAGLRAAAATLRQIIRQCGGAGFQPANSRAAMPALLKLPCLKIRDWPDFARRGVMLDISRGRVPKLETLLDLAEKLADFKINELQLYTEHTFAYRKYKSAWQNWGALTGAEIRTLDARCRELGIDLVPNQNSFGHLREFLAHPQLKKLAEVSAPYEDASREFIRRPTTLAPNHPGTLLFLRGLYDELLPNFSSRFFNVGCDETWDMGRGQSKRLCEKLGNGRVYLNFLKQICREVSSRGKTMMFWGDIILKYPELIQKLKAFGFAPSGEFPTPPQGRTPNIIALNWGYEANHPFATEAAQFAKAGIPFYVCPGTSTWQTLIGRHDNALGNLRAAAKAGKRFGAIGYLITDWGDGGHPQPLAVSWPVFAAGAALGWNVKGFDERKSVPALARDIFGNVKIAETAFKLGFVHKKLGVAAPNETPLGTVIAAPPLRERELFCRNGLGWFAKIPAAKIHAALKEIETLRVVLRRGVSAERRHIPPKPAALCLVAATELDLAARMAAQSCQFMLWQQALAARRNAEAKRLAQTGIRELRRIEKDFNALWPLRNKATPKHCSAFLRWRLADYRRGFVV